MSCRIFVSMASDPTTRPDDIRPRRLWFGLVTAAVAWFSLGIAEMFITWRACLHNEEFGNASSHPAAMIAAYVVSFLLIGLVAVGWLRLLSQLAATLHAAQHPASRRPQPQRVRCPARRLHQRHTRSRHGLDGHSPLHSASLREGAMNLPCWPICIAAIMALFCAARPRRMHRAASKSRIDYAGVIGNPHDGKKLIVSYGCGSCHTIPGVYTARGAGRASALLLRPPHHDRRRAAEYARKSDSLAAQSPPS